MTVTFDIILHVFDHFSERSSIQHPDMTDCFFHGILRLITLFSTKHVSFLVFSLMQVSLSIECKLLWPVLCWTDIMPYCEIKDMANRDNSLKPLTFNPKKIQRNKCFLKIFIIVGPQTVFFLNVSFYLNDIKLYRKVEMSVKSCFKCAVVFHGLFELWTFLQHCY